MLSEWYAKKLFGVLERMPVERAMLDLFAEMTLGVGVEVADVGCGTGRLRCASRSAVVSRARRSASSRAGSVTL